MRQYISESKVKELSKIFMFNGLPVLVMEHPVYKGYFCGVDGHVYSVKSKSVKRLKQSKQKSGYMKVTLTDNGKLKSCWTHRLVADAWIEPSDQDRHGNPRNQINHINSIKSDNRLCNLERNSAKENADHHKHIAPLLKQCRKKNL